AWAGFFLFPGLLAYDSNLSVGADHVAAVFAPAGLLAILPAMRTLSPALAVLVGLVAGGATLTKYSAISVAIPLLFAMAARAGVFLRRGIHRRKAMVSVGLAFGAFAVATAPHFVKNWVWYGDPAFPILHDWFSAHPWTRQAESYHRIFLKLCILSPTRDLDGVVESLKAALTLGFGVQSYGFHDDVPTFGFLFAATLYCLPFTRPPWRVKAAYALSFTAVLTWYWTNHRDRYLQACLPWLVAATLATLHRMWTEFSWPAKFGALGLVVAQGLAGAGLGLAPMSFMIPSGHALPEVISLVGAGYKGNYDERFQPYEDWGFSAWTELGRYVPRGARVLVHEDRLWLGLDAPVVIDEAAWQGGIEYGNLGSPRAVYDLIRSFGARYVVTGKYHPDGGGHGLAGELVFSDLLSRYAKPVRKVDKLTLFRLPDAPPPDTPLGGALIVTCNQSQPVGYYAPGTINQRVPEISVSAANVPAEAFERAAYVILEDQCDFPDLRGKAKDAGFEEMRARGNVSFWRRSERVVKPVSAGP
ncbi:MAG TPA: hypothetical protein VHE30_06115, partial [Polyangiaceae bacterium]|nr:hypothetical protein [Polyangiaceae bacterium]